VKLGDRHRGINAGGVIIQFPIFDSQHRSVPEELVKRGVLNWNHQSYVSRGHLQHCLVRNMFTNECSTVPTERPPELCEIERLDPQY
jgi:hypothetical protein